MQPLRRPSHRHRPLTRIVTSLAGVMLASLAVTAGALAAAAGPLQVPPGQPHGVLQASTLAGPAPLRPRPPLLTHAAVSGHALPAGWSPHGGVPLLAHLVAGGDVWYHIQPGDTVAALASRFGVDGDGLAQRAHLYPRLDANLYTRPLPVGSALEIDSHYIVPADLKNGILVSIAQFGQWLHAFSFGTLKTLFEVSIHSTGRQ